MEETGYVKAFRLKWSAVLVLNFKMAANSQNAGDCNNRRTGELEINNGMYI